MKKSICAESNHVKTRFDKNQKGLGIGDAANPVKTGIKVSQTISENLFPQTKQICTKIIIQVNRKECFQYQIRFVFKILLESSKKGNDK